jgi:TPR repeat protein
MNTKPLVFLLSLTFLIFFANSSSVFADDFQDGMAAAQRGESKEAVRLFRLSAAQGNPTAQYNMGYMYEIGQGVPQDYKEAIKWFRIAAEQGLAQAKFKLGLMHANGQGVSQDYKEAVKWYSLSAKQGFLKAQFNLALMYANGQGVSQDYKEAFKWFRLAAEQGDSISQYSLGVMYAQGEGVSQDYVLAHMWLSLSASQGYQGAIEGRDIAEKQMTPQQIEKAQEMALTRGDVELLLKQAEETLSADKKELAKELYLKASERGSVKAHFNLAYRFVLTPTESVYHFSEAAKGGHRDALGYALNGLLFRANSLKIADPKRALALYYKAKKMNPSLHLYDEKNKLKIMRMCVEPGKFDAEAFSKKYDLLPENKATMYHVWRIAEEVSLGGRFGKPDPALILHLVCRGGWAPAELEIGVEETYKNWKSGEAKEFKICDHITSGGGMSFCASRAYDEDKNSRESKLNELEDKLGHKSKPILREAYESAAKFIEAKTLKEEMHSGSGVGAWITFSHMGQKNEYLDLIAKIHDGFKPSPVDNFDKADQLLNQTYKKTINFLKIEKEKNYLLPTPDQLREVQRLWIPYRDVSAKLFAIISPTLEEDLWKSWLTDARIKQLNEIFVEGDDSNQTNCLTGSRRVDCIKNSKNSTGQGNVGVNDEKNNIFNEISTTKENQMCGGIKYSIINLGVGGFGGNKDHIKIKAFNKEGKSVFEEDSTSFVNFACRDITNDGNPELIIDTWGGGNAACSNAFHILSSKQLEGKSHVQVLLSSEGFNGVEDVDGDGVSEVITCRYDSYGENGKSYLSQAKCLKDAKYVDCISKVEGTNTINNHSMKVVHDIPIASRATHDGYVEGYPDDTIIVSVEYTNIINGMRVGVVWKPVDSYSDSIVGEATIKFANVKGGASFSIVNPSFGLRRDTLEKLKPIWEEYEDGSFKLKLDRDSILLEYKSPEFEDEIDVLGQLYDFDIPFFFYDLDFDNNKELIIVLHGAGQRGMDIYKVYALKDGKLVDKQEQITDDEPYLELDGLSTISTRNKTINIHGSGGACNNFDKTYRFKPSGNRNEKGKYILEEYSLRESADDRSCNAFAYRVDKNRKLTLISKHIPSSTPRQNTSEQSISPSKIPQPKEEQAYPKIIQGENGGYKVTLRVFKTKVLAEKFKAKLLKQGLTPNVEQKGSQWELFIGPYPSEESANQAKSSAEQGDVDAKNELSLALAESKEARDSFERGSVKKEIPNKLIEFRKPKESIEIHSSHFDRCAGEKIKVFEFTDLIFYSMKAPLSCLLSPLSITKPKSKSRAGGKFDQDVTENTLVGLDSSGKDILLVYSSSFDEVFGGDGPMLPAAEGLIKLGESGRVIIFTAPSTDQGVIRIDQVSGEYFIVKVGMSTHVRTYLISTTSLKAEYLSDGFIEMVDRDKLIFKAHGRKSYFKEVGGAFWYNAIIDRNGKIIDIDNEDLDPNSLKYCYAKSDFLKKADIGLPESARDIICVYR